MNDVSTYHMTSAAGVTATWHSRTAFDVFVGDLLGCGLFHDDVLAHDMSLNVRPHGPAYWSLSFLTAERRPAEPLLESGMPSVLHCQCSLFGNVTIFLSSRRSALCVRLSLSSFESLSVNISMCQKVARERAVSSPIVKTTL